MFPDLTAVVSHDSEVYGAIWYAGGTLWSQYESSRLNCISYSLIAAMSHKSQIMRCEMRSGVNWRRNRRVWVNSGQNGTTGGRFERVRAAQTGPGAVILLAIHVSQLV